MKLDWQLILSSGIVIIMGILIHFSVSPQDIEAHIIYITLGILLAGITARIDTKIYPCFDLHFFSSSIFLLLLTLIVGVTTRGSTRWLDIGPLRFQTSEIVKLFQILSLPQILQRTHIRRFIPLLRTSIIFCLPLTLVFIQPDFGSAMVVAAITLTILYSAGIRYRHLLTLFTILIILSPLVWMTLHDYQKNRIQVFLDPTSDPLGKGYNSIQALIAVGSGQITGRGLGHGTQSKLRFLPEYQTDFVFASLAEELGLIGCLLLISAYSWMLFRLIYIADHTKDSYSYLVMMGIISMFASQIIINIGMNLAVLPITGITLPLISNGGTSILISLIALGISLKIASRPLNSSGIEISAR